MPDLRLLNRLDHDGKIPVQRTPLGFVRRTDAGGTGGRTGAADAKMEEIFVRGDGMTVDRVDNVQDFRKVRFELAAPLAREATVPFPVTVRTTYADCSPHSVPVLAIGRHGAPSGPEGGW
jgi:hypothetical protein